MRYPSLYEVNTRVVLAERGQALGRRATLDDLEDSFLDQVAARGFDWLWLLGVWQTGPAGRAVSRGDAKLRAELQQELPDLREDDIVGSPFAIFAYDVNRDFGGDAALARLRERAKRRGLKLLLDFVPNHVAPDHAWVRSHPEYFAVDLMGSARYDRRGDDLVGSGLYLDLPAWGYHLFEITTRQGSRPQGAMG